MQRTRFHIETRIFNQVYYRQLAYFRPILRLRTFCSVSRKLGVHRIYFHGGATREKFAHAELSVWIRGVKSQRCWKSSRKKASWVGQHSELRSKNTKSTERFTFRLRQRHTSNIKNGSKVLVEHVQTHWEADTSDVRYCWQHLRIGGHLVTQLLDGFSIHVGTYIPPKTIVLASHRISVGLSIVSLYQ